MIGTIAFAVGAFVAAAWLHEVTHAAAARLLGGEVVEMDLVSLHVDFALESELRTRLVLLAPGIVGLAVAPVGIYLLDGVSIYTAIAAVAWGIYTLNGGTEGELGIPTLQRFTFPDT